MSEMNEGPSEPGPGVGPPPEVAEKAADRAVAEERLLPGEEPSSSDTEDASHWIAVYSELLTFKRGILERSTDEAAAMSQVAKREVESTDLVVLSAEAARLERRLSFWQNRLAQSRKH